jgi:hypothetical protein
MRRECEWARMRRECEWAHGCAARTNTGPSERP